MIQKKTWYLDKLKITPDIKVRKNSSIKNNINCTPRKLLLLSVLEQFKDIIDGRKNINWIYRWIAESAFSLSIKRTFGEHIYHL
jgi:hypothetical protein